MQEKIDSGGIPNLGNTCYLNAGLQIIAKLYPDTFDGQQSPLAIAGRAIIDKIKDDKDHVTVEEAQAFYDSFLNLFGDRHRRNTQEDAEECLSGLLKDRVVHPDSIWARMISTKGIVHKYGSWKEEESFSAAPLRSFLPGKSYITMQDCLRYDFEDKHFVGEHQYDDPQLGKVDAVRQSRLLINRDSPIPLYIQARRFTNTGRKNRKDINGALNLTVPANIQYAPNGGANDLDYHLQGFVMHIGPTKDLGHYVAYIKQKGTGQWRVYNDTKTLGVTQKHAAEQAKQAFLYFYKKAN